MKVVFLTWGETPRSYGVFGSQAIAQFVASKRQMGDGSEFSFISALPIVHSGFVREKLNFFKELTKVKHQLENIPFSIIPIYTTQNFVNSSKTTLGLMHIGAHWHLKRKLQSIKPDIVHCRSYHAAWAALSVRKKYKFNYKIVFDARALWPEEIALKKRWKVNDENYVFLKSLECELLLSSDATVAVSDPMTEHFLDLSNQRVETIYNSTSAKNLGNSVKGINKKNTTLCYVGALANNSWHEPILLLELYLKFRECVTNPRLLIVTTSSHKKLLKDFSVLSTEELTITSSKSIDELTRLLSTADYGALPYRKASVGYEELLAKAVLATKTVEYLASGLPVLVNKQCEGAASIITKYDLGIAYDPLNLAAIDAVALNKYKNDEISKNAKKLAHDLFDYEANAKRYCDLYTSLL
ncbi:MAG: glycosyltransferase [Methyloglobulus sp.]|nr:glycosyltransferase [Methyloglobulus sp.]